MTDGNSNTPAWEHDPSTEFQPDYDDYGLYEQDTATGIIRIDTESSVFERIGKIESASTGVILKRHTKLADDVAQDSMEVYEPIQFVSARSDEFETRLQNTIFDFVHAGKVSEELAEQLSADFAETLSDNLNETSELG
jgi:hypothetical protein